MFKSRKKKRAAIEAAFNKTIDAAASQAATQAASEAIQPDRVNAVLHDLVAMVKPDGQPNINALWHELKELNAIKWSVKQQGYAIGRQVFEHTKTLPVPDKPEAFTLDCKPSTQADVQSPWFLYWMDQLQSAPLPHRKLWEFAWILQNLHGHGKLTAGQRALGFGCGTEPFPSYFANLGIDVVATDLAPEEVHGRGWAETGQHTASLDAIYEAKLAPREAFDRHVSLDYVDMNDIPAKYDGQFDFCWSICALEHLGSIKNGLDFIEASLNTLKPGGIALHTTEFNYTEIDLTTDNWQTVLFLRRDFEALAKRLNEAGHTVAPLNFDVGHDPLDCFVDLPPFEFDKFMNYQPDDSSYREGHLKTSVDGFPSTCFGFAVQKKA
ncbi:methyltransferase domain-containing protein [Ruegeria sp. HKCCD6228]|uniref:SAM-dependent methyltransferase n=1 Tax=unclassified Ruegeria TaxID=2625375 RepID=UPI0014876436|nr:MULTISPECIES: methyltransferase domain-containing protein [unclassified Ruegeria]NOD99479.1 methyltransferase domain-containing protein [Ruegeria sp. HKCCD6228]